MKNHYDDAKFCAEMVLERVSEDPMITHKIKLARLIVSELISRGLNQTCAAKLLETSQPRLSNLVVGRLDRFSVDFLLTCAEILGYNVGLTFTKSENV